MSTTLLFFPPKHLHFISQLKGLDTAKFRGLNRYPITVISAQLQVWHVYFVWLANPIYTHKQL